MHADSFEDLVTQCLLSGFKHRMLYVFVRVSALNEEAHALLGGADMDAEASFVQVLFDGHQPLLPGLKFEQVREAADGHSREWNLCVVGIAKNSDASLPTEEQAQSFLADMRERVLAGDIEDFAVLDRAGLPIDLESEEIPADPAKMN